MNCPKCGSELKDGECPDCGYNQFLIKENPTETDMRRLTVTPRDLLMASLYAEIRTGEPKTWEEVSKVLKNWSVKIGGKGHRDIIRQSDKNNGNINIEEEIDKTKNLYDRNWKEDGD